MAKQAAPHLAHRGSLEKPPRRSRRVLENQRDEKQRRRHQWFATVFHFSCDRVKHGSRNKSSRNEGSNEEELERIPCPRFNSMDVRRLCPNVVVAVILSNASGADRPSG